MVDRYTKRNWFLIPSEIKKICHYDYIQSSWIIDYIIFNYIICSDNIIFNLNSRLYCIQLYYVFRLYSFQSEKNRKSMSRLWLWIVDSAITASKSTIAQKISRSKKKSTPNPPSLYYTKKNKPVTETWMHSLRCRHILPFQNNIPFSSYNHIYYMYYNKCSIIYISVAAWIKIP